MWDTSRARKLRKKWGKLIRTEQTQIDDMLAHQMEEVQQYLLEKKKDFVDPGDDTSTDDNMSQGLRSPPLPVSGLRSPRQASVPVARNGDRMPPMGFFTVGNSPRLGTNSPRSPKSPLRQDFRRG